MLYLHRRVAEVRERMKRLLIKTKTKKPSKFCLDADYFLDRTALSLVHRIIPCIWSQAFDANVPDALVLKWQPVGIIIIIRHRMPTWNFFLERYQFCDNPKTGYILHDWAVSGDASFSGSSCSIRAAPSHIAKSHQDIKRPQITSDRFQVNGERYQA